MASKLEKFFHEADTDGSGYLTVDELIALLRKKGYKASDEKIRVSKPGHALHAVYQCRPRNKHCAYQYSFPVTTVKSRGMESDCPYLWTTAKM